MDEKQLQLLFELIKDGGDQSIEDVDVLTEKILNLRKIIKFFEILTHKKV